MTNNNITIVSSDAPVVAALKSDIDIYSADDFYNIVSAAYNAAKGDVVLDCEQLDYIDSTAIGAIVKLYKLVAADGNKLIIRNMKPRQKKLFEICAIDRLMEFE